MKKIFPKFNLMLLGVVLICGCNYENMTKALLNKSTNPADDKFAQEYFQIVRNHDTKTALSLLVPQMRATVQESDIENISSYIDSGEITSVELIGSKVTHKNGMKIAELSYQYQIDNNWFLVNAAVEEEVGRQQIAGFNVNPLPKSLQELNALTFTNKGIIQYLFFALVLLVYGLTIYAVVFCIKSNIKMKWLWIFLLFTCVGEVSLNWTTGQILFNRFSLGWAFPFGTGVSRSLNALYTPWVVNIKLPIGFIVFLFKGRKQIESNAQVNEKDSN